MKQEGSGHWSEVMGKVCVLLAMLVLGAGMFLIPQIVINGTWRAEVFIMLMAAMFVSIFWFPSDVIKFGRLLFIYALFIAGLTGYCQYQMHHFSSFKDLGVVEFTVVKGESKSSGSGNRKDYKRVTYYARYQGTLENGESLSYTKKIDSFGKLQKMVRNKATEEKKVFLLDGEYQLANPQQSKEGYWEELTGWTGNSYLFAGGFALAGVMVIAGSLLNRKRKSKREKEGWTFIWNGEEQDTADLGRILNALEQLDAQEDSFVVLARFIHTASEQYLQAFADFDEEDDVFYVLDRGIKQEYDNSGASDNCAHYVYNTWEMDEVKEIFENYYRNREIDYDKFELR